HYTSALAEDTKKPYFYLGNELNNLTDTIETMKHRLENRAYVSDYVHTLTHELKSPLTAIRASSELLEDERLDGDDRQMLSQAIGEQSIKMQQL
ncbi:histidine kinase dimerization/phospho-acceptor domain-containing protein, partial [Psychrobacter sp. TB55-MNA-CIBAN-0194]|uniref:histidine kinase dimerization/phospho-acceptor domain-containing protein n=1 Tax=Psychrobacter sp. TB55-MNA-CIBAN-0194 TaxID=3140445 RepID=UPI003317A473